MTDTGPGAERCALCKRKAVHHRLTARGQLYCLELARHFGLTHWPQPCPVCHSDAPNGRPLQLSPTRRGGARFRCRYCLTTFARNRRRVAQAIDRLGLIAVPRTPRSTP